MPLYDFECADCGHRFEALVRNSSAPTCPACQGSRLNQQISMFSVDSASSRQSNLAGARQQNKKFHREKATAEFEAMRDHHD